MLLRAKAHKIVRLVNVSGVSLDSIKFMAKVKGEVAFVHSEGLYEEQR